MLYVSSRALAQKLDEKEQTLNHDNYVYDKKNDEIIFEGYMYKRSGFIQKRQERRYGRFTLKSLRRKKIFHIILRKGLG